MKCGICTLDIESNQPTAEIPEIAGGGTAHAACMEAVSDLAIRLLEEIPLEEDEDVE